MRGIAIRFPGLVNPELLEGEAEEIEASTDQDRRALARSACDR